MKLTIENLVLDAESFPKYMHVTVQGHDSWHLKQFGNRVDIRPYKPPTKKDKKDQLLMEDK